jgi:hypothetical protein
MPTGNYAEGHQVKYVSTSPRPSFVIAPRAVENYKTRDPRTPYLSPKAFLTSRAANGTARNGISPKYSLNDFWSLSELTNTSWMPFASALALNFAASTGVNPPQGGHLRRSNNPDA